MSDKEKIKRLIIRLESVVGLINGNNPQMAALKVLASISELKEMINTG